MNNVFAVTGGRMFLFLLIFCDEYKADLHEAFT